MSTHESNNIAEPKKKFKPRHLLFALIPAAVLFLVLEAFASIIYYQMKGSNKLAILSLAQHAVTIAKTGKDSPKMAEQRYLRFAEHRKLENFELEAAPNYLACAENFVNKKYPRSTDENGFIQPSKVHEKADLDIIFVGGSTTECQFMEVENRFPFKTGRLLEERTGKKINSYNHGISAMTSMHSLHSLINKFLPMQPDYVVLMHAINDMNVMLYEGSYWNDHPFRSLIVDPNNPRFNNNDRYNQDEWIDARDKQIVMDTSKMIHDFSASLRSFVSICKIWGIEPVLMTQANRFNAPSNSILWAQTLENLKKNGISHEQIKAMYERLNQCTRDVAAQEKVLLVDLAKEVPQTKEYMHDLVHFTDKGSLLVAELVTNTLMRKFSLAKDSIF